ncbi:jg1920 [Pararge aegeria aegeria]|uniref:Jg1920 protein n=1 Tax=Pararge aegeria aegeria TaxID=348720 RepID=A0A8S4R3G0_9NEOP|nr:jg1920 [Pararge aegeria aegeria]
MSKTDLEFTDTELIQEPDRDRERQRQRETETERDRDKARQRQREIERDRDRDGAVSDRFQRQVDKAMLGVSLGTQISNEEILRRTKATDLSSSKGPEAKVWQWAGPIARRNDGRWGPKELEWQSYCT